MVVTQCDLYPWIFNIEIISSFIQLLNLNHHHIDAHKNEPFFIVMMSVVYWQTNCKFGINYLSQRVSLKLALDWWLYNSSTSHICVCTVNTADQTLMLLVKITAGEIHYNHHVYFYKCMTTEFLICTMWFPGCRSHRQHTLLAFCKHETLHPGHEHLHWPLRAGCVE